MKFFLILLNLLFVTALQAQNLDLLLLEHINTPVNHHTDQNWRLVSQSTLPVVLAAPMALFIAGQLKGSTDLKMRAYESVASLAGSYVFGKALKTIVKRDRPFITYPNDIIKKEDENGYGFPSSHASLAFSAAASLSIACSKWYVILPSYSYAAAVSYSRLYLGIHYPSDVLAGALIGTGSSWFTYKANKWLQKKLHK